MNNGIRGSPVNMSKPQSDAFKVGPIYNQWAIPPDYPVNYLSWKDLATYVEATLDSDKLNGGLCRIGVIKALAEMN